MNDNPILICYDGSADARRAIEAAAELLGPRRATVLDVGPVIRLARSERPPRALRRKHLA